LVKRVGNSEKAFVAPAVVETPVAPAAEEVASGRGGSFALSSPKVPPPGFRYPRQLADARAAASQAAPRGDPNGKKRAPEYYNLRYRRTPAKPWRVESGELVATVKGIPVRTTLDYSRWRLVVDIDGPRDLHLLSVTSTTQDVVITRFPEAARSSKHIEVEVTAPPICPAMPRREYVTLVVRYQVGNQERTQRLDVDHRCLVGDFYGRKADEALARLARGYLHDPLIEHLVRGASLLPVGTPEEEVRHLKEWVGFGRKSVPLDPPILGRSEEGNPYVLSPTETARLGGDCKDWAVLVTAYLTRRGLRAGVADYPGHVWVQVDYKGKIYDIDFLGDPPKDPPLSVAWVTEEPSGSDTFLKYNFGRFSEKLQLSRGRSRNERQISRRKR